MSLTEDVLCHINLYQLVSNSLFHSSLSGRIWIGQPAVYTATHPGVPTTTAATREGDVISFFKKDNFFTSTNVKINSVK